MVEPFETPISKNHTLDTSLDQKTSKVPKEYRVSYLSENTEVKALSEGGHGNYIFDTKSFKYKFKRIHLDTPQVQNDPNPLS